MPNIHATARPKYAPDDDDNNNNNNNNDDDGGGDGDDGDCYDDDDDDDDDDGTKHMINKSSSHILKIHSFSHKNFVIK